jgi:RNA polymerase sigma-70 factor (ECF subfamily)
MDDEAFRRGMRRRDAAVWTRLVQLYDPPLRHLAERILGPGHDAENAVGDMWVKALAGARGYDPRLRPFPWLARICANTCLSQRRRALRRIQGEPQRTGRDRRSEAEEGARALRAALCSLPKREREVVTLRYLFEISVAEITQLTQRSRKTVEKTLFRALRRLRETLDETGLGDLQERA